MHQFMLEEGVGKHTEQTKIAELGIVPGSMQSNTLTYSGLA